MRVGYRLRLDKSSWMKIEKRARWSIRKASRHLEVRTGSLEELAAMHWNPLYLPTYLKRNQRIYTATYKGQPVASILVEVDGSLITYKYAASDPAYNEYNGNSLLIWSLVDRYPGRILDLGGSAKPGIDRFKRQFATETYAYKPRNKTWAKLKFRLTRTLPMRLARPFKPGGRIQRITRRFQRHVVSPLKRGVIHVSCDDLNLTSETPQDLIDLHREFPKLRVTFFTVPFNLQHNADAVALLREKWATPAIHGYRHSPGELWNIIPKERMNFLLREGRAIFNSLGLRSTIFKPPNYRWAPSLAAALSEEGFTHAFLENHQFRTLTYRSTAPVIRGGLTWIPTNYSVWFRDRRRLNAILKKQGYLSVQTHVTDFPRHTENLRWILTEAEKERYIYDQLEP